MLISGDVWTCPVCGGTERLPGAPPERDAARSAAQLEHGRRHHREGRESVPLREALADALGQAATGAGPPLVARVMVHPRDVGRLRTEVTRRRVRVALCESLAVRPGSGLALTPVAGLDRRAGPR